MTELARLKFYATQPHSCSYLPEEQATTLFLDPSQPMDVHVYADLFGNGFSSQWRPPLPAPLSELQCLRTGTPPRRRNFCPIVTRSASSSATPT